jgi:ABC-type Fe3+ transport system substrate-binding protein
MMWRYGFILMFVALLALPLVLRAVGPGVAGPGPAGGAAGERLVIITAHTQDIRNEFRWAFADWHQRKYGRRVDLEYLSPGGANDIKRQLDNFYSQARASHGGSLPPEDSMDVTIDLVWGGGDFYFDHDLKSLGILKPIPIDPKLLAQVFPTATLAGTKLYDADATPPRWIGICLASFGIIYNPDLYRSMDLAAPTRWDDLADPQLCGSVALADPTHSASAAVIYLIVIERAMADAESQFFNQPQNHGVPVAALKGSPAYSSALDAGWKRGMDELVLLAANARYFSDSASRLPNDVAGGDAAAGVSIDYYGRATEQDVGSGRLRFILPVGGTAITSDPIAILYGVHGRRLESAQHFIEYLLSPEGQRLWILEPGQPGGPRQRALHRAPIRRSVYTDRAGWADDLDYFTAAEQFAQRPEWGSMLSDLRPIWAAAWIDARDDLRRAYIKILAVRDDQQRRGLLERLSDIPISRSDLAALIATRRKIESDPMQDPDQWKARQRLYWARRFMEHYRAVGALAQ